MVRLLFVVICLVAAAAPAAADIGITRIAPQRARVGAVVSVTVNAYVGLRLPRMPVVLAPKALMPSPGPCDRGSGTGICEPVAARARLERAPFRVVGRLRGWQTDRKLRDHATATLRFRVPPIEPGRYVIALWCASCASGADGSLIAGGELTVFG